VAGVAVGLILIGVGVVLVIAMFVVIKNAIQAGDAAAIRSGDTAGIPSKVRRASLGVLLGLVAIVAGIVVAIVA
jgi:hypothetical protein